MVWTLYDMDLLRKFRNSNRISRDEIRHALFLTTRKMKPKADGHFLKGASRNGGEAEQSKGLKMDGHVSNLSIENISNGHF